MKPKAVEATYFNPYVPGVVCFTNRAQFPLVKEHAVYGNVDFGDRPGQPSGQSLAHSRRTRFAKLRDLFSVRRDSLVFFFLTGDSVLHGVWKVTGDPFYSSEPIFDTSNVYPYRFQIQHSLNFRNPVPAFELRKLLNCGALWTIRSFEREANALFSSVNPITKEETKSILELFWKYNHTTDPLVEAAAPNNLAIPQSMSANELVMNDVYDLDAATFIVAGSQWDESWELRYEEALQCHLAYHLSRLPHALSESFGRYSELVREVPVSIAGQNRPDFLLVYEDGFTGLPCVYSVVEMKRGIAGIGMMKQLTEYVRLLMERKCLDASSTEGVLVASGFEEPLIDYIRNRQKIETTSDVRLVKYSVAEGRLSFTPVLIE